MPSEFEDPDLAPIRARQIGRRQILRWAVVTAAAGAVVAWLGPVLTVLGTGGPTEGFSPGDGSDEKVALEYLSALVPPFVAVGTGLAVAATVEVRRAIDPVESRERLGLWLAWGLLALAALGFFLAPATP
ncbi:MAG: hypothetical protein IIC52_10375 [Proteobacteria bacterium]|nr:hypothetical protein [Pseudomonadota bacterium]